MRTGARRRVSVLSPSVVPVRVASHVVFCAQLALLDLIVRGPGFYAANPRAALYPLASLAVLHLAATASRPRAARGAVALALGTALVGQLAFYRYYHAPLDDQVALAARQAWQDVRPMLLRKLPALVVGTLVVGAAEYAWLSTTGAERRRGRAAIAVLATAFVLGGPLRHGTLELRSAQAAARLALSARPGVAVGRPALGPLSSTRDSVPNVLFVLTESVRAADWCGEPTEPCLLSPEVHELLPERVALRQMRAVSAYSALTLSVLLTGRSQLGAREPILAAPDLFDVVRAARVGRDRMGIHYWSAHSGTVFERTDVPAIVDSYVSADTLLGRPIDDVEDAVIGGLDRRLADACEARLPALASPYLAFVHFSGTHAPYFFDDDRAPFTPFSRHVTWSGLHDLHSAYRNAIVEQDRSIARCIRAFLASQRDGRWVVVFTSDHGEAFGEHSAIHHGQNLYDEQIHVPAFVAYGAQALDAEQQRALAAARDAYVTHLDLLPTLLDALGLLDHFALASAAAAMPGASLLRPRGGPMAPLAVTNCSAMWQCPINGWGVLAAGRKLLAQPWDGQWRCTELEGAEHEVALERCRDLVAVSQRAFATKPNGAPND